MHEFAPRLHPLATPARAEAEGTVQLGREQVKLIERYHQAVTAARFAQQEAAELRSQILALGSGPSWVGAYRGRRLVEVREICRSTPQHRGPQGGLPGGLRGRAAGAAVSDRPGPPQRRAGGVVSVGLRPEVAVIEGMALRLEAPGHCDCRAGTCQHLRVALVWANADLRTVAPELVEEEP